MKIAVAILLLESKGRRLVVAASFCLGVLSYCIAQGYFIHALSNKALAKVASSSLERQFRLHGANQHKGNVALTPLLEVWIGLKRLGFRAKLQHRAI